MVRLFTLAAALLLALAGPASAKDWTTVKVGIEGAFPPWNAIGPDGKLYGLDVDMINDLCRRAHVQCELLQNDWASIIPSLNAGKFDLAMTLGVNEARRKVVDFTYPYASGVASFAILRDGPLAPFPMTGERLNLNDHAASDPVMADLHQRLQGKAIGVVNATSQEQLIRAYFGDDVTVRTYKSSPERDLDLRAGRIDAAFDSGVYMTTMRDKPGNEDLQMTGPLMKGAMLATDVAIGLRKGEPELQALFNKAIREAAEDGTIRAISTKWSKLDLTPSLPAE
ncbi:transporter substrate-binding domain-containing protein [Sphingomonas sp.]|uniref:transporter substrate-binding domain-containing protein n=1 Tax=Sphingomonas sp. TaxID=28214 RepID=UPI0025E0F4E9|nr:transporter substrate-binding domain-containing protein [Sphingomonas sp.]MBV9528794.1 transporter substrate-binding domain-containing protein [Sphingomonas sp.]